MIVEQIRNAVSSLENYVFLHELKPVANEKLDKITGKISILYCIEDWEISTARGNKYNETIDVNWFFLSRFSNIGENGATLHATIQERLKDALKALETLQNGPIVIENETISAKSVFDDYDGGFCGVSLQFKIKTKQSICISNL